MKSYPRREIGSAPLGTLLTALVVLGAAAPVSAVAASSSTALAGDNNDLTFTAKTKGALGVSVTYVNPGVETATEVVTVSRYDITVTLRSVGGTLSTAAQVKAAIEANAAANALVTVANAAANDGTGNVIAMAKLTLAGGVDGTEAEAGTIWLHGGYLYATQTRATRTGAAWSRVQLTAV